MIDHSSFPALLEKEARIVLAKYLGVDAARLKISHLGSGCDNIVFFAELVDSIESVCFAVLISRQLANECAHDFSSERAFLRWGAPRGLTPELFADGETPSGRRFLIEERIPGTPLSALELRCADIQAKVVSILRELHTAGPTLPRCETAQAQLNNTLNRVAAVPSERLDPVQSSVRGTFLTDAMRRVEEVSHHTSHLDLVAVHHDIQPQNLMRKNRDIILIDARPASMGWAFADVACAALYFSEEGRVQDGLRIAANLYGIEERLLVSFYTVAYMKYARRAGVILETQLLSQPSLAERVGRRFRRAMRDADDCYLLINGLG